MIGKATLEDFSKARQVKDRPLHQINDASFHLQSHPLRGMTCQINNQFDYVAVMFE
jgi:hypothetical protein